MTDQDHAEALRRAYLQLIDAIRAATRDGLRICAYPTDDDPARFGLDVSRTTRYPIVP